MGVCAFQMNPRDTLKGKRDEGVGGTLQIRITKVLMEKAGAGI